MPSVKNHTTKATHALFRFSERPIIATMILLCSLATIAVTLLLSGCQSLGLQSATTFNEKIASGYASIAAIRDTAATLLTAKQLNLDTAKSVQKQADQLRALLDAARITYGTDTSAGTDQLQRALIAIAALQSYVGTYKGSSP